LCNFLPALHLFIIIFIILYKKLFFWNTLATSQTICSNVAIRLETKLHNILLKSNQSILLGELFKWELAGKFFCPFCFVRLLTNICTPTQHMTHTYTIHTPHTCNQTCNSLINSMRSWVTCLSMWKTVCARVRSREVSNR